MTSEQTDPTTSTLSYWDEFYADRRSTAVPERPSPFAEWVSEDLGGAKNIVELGFGTGRDTFWLADQGHTLQAYDGAHSAVERAGAHASEHGIAAGFGQLDLTDTDQVLQIADGLRAAEATDVVYGRFLLHSLTDVGRANLFTFAARALKPGGQLYLEFRTGKDADAPHLFGNDHFRVYLDAEDVAETIRGNGGTVTHLEQGYGLAPYKTEDPHVARIVATWDSER